VFGKSIALLALSFDSLVPRNVRQVGMCLGWMKIQVFVQVLLGVACRPVWVVSDPTL